MVSLTAGSSPEVGELPVQVYIKCFLLEHVPRFCPTVERSKRESLEPLYSS